ncbi:hypothetical protein V2I01_32155 [Micromonospora sp. BRA006-A]|nr:hypothetical protein [Micromonospora sp. BRA006-A]
MPAVAGVAGPVTSRRSTPTRTASTTARRPASGDGDVHQLIAVGDGTFRTSTTPGGRPEVYPVSGTPPPHHCRLLQPGRRTGLRRRHHRRGEHVYGNAGTDPTFGPGGLLLDGRSVADVAVADFDRDLRPDLAAVDPRIQSDPDDDRVLVFRNLNGTFDQRFLLGDQPSYVRPDFSPPAT